MKLHHNNTIPLEAQYLYRWGMEMVNLQRTDPAVIYFRQAVFIAPCFSRAYWELGNCLARLGRSEEASVFHMKASRIDPVHCNAAGDGLPWNDENQNAPGHFLTCLVW